MTVSLLNALLMLFLALNLFSLGSSRIVTIIRIVAAQGVLLGIIPLLVHHVIQWPALLASAAAIILKSLVVPGILTRALLKARIKKEVEPLIGLLPSLLLGALGTACALLFSTRLTLVDHQDAMLIIPAAISTIFTGFILIITRYKAITQVLGYLVLENGIYIFSLLLLEAIPVVVELGMLLDLFIGIFVISIITNHINRAFSSMDTRNLNSLKEP